MRQTGLVSVFRQLTFWLKRFFSGLPRKSAVAGVLEHLGTLPLNAQCSLVLVRLKTEILLLGLTPQNITLLTNAPTHGSANSSACMLEEMLTRDESISPGALGPSSPLKSAPKRAHSETL